MFWDLPDSASGSVTSAELVSFVGLILGKLTSFYMVFSIVWVCVKALEELGACGACLLKLKLQPLSVCPTLSHPVRRIPIPSYSTG